MAEAKAGDTVRVKYRGTLADGSDFDVSPDGCPFEFTLGEEAVIAGFEQAILGMNVGESKTVTIPPEAGYGEWREELVGQIGRAHLPDEVEAEVGGMLEIISPEGEALPVRVVKVEGDMITLDANPELAGMELTFKLELVEIVSNSE